MAEKLRLGPWAVQDALEMMGSVARRVLSVARAPRETEDLRPETEDDRRRLR